MVKPIKANAMAESMSNGGGMFPPKKGGKPAAKKGTKKPPMKGGKC